MIAQFLDPQLVQALGYTLLHSLWQGAAFALLLAVVFIALRSYSAQARYVVSVGLLAAFCVTVGATFYQQHTTATVACEAPAALPAALATEQALTGVTTDLATSTAPGCLPAAAALASTDTPSTVAVEPAVGSSFFAFLGDYYARHLPLLVTLWLIGVLVLQLRFLGQLAVVQRLKHYGTTAVPTVWLDRFRTLEEKLRLRKTVRYRLTNRTEMPMAIGWLKPVVLLPRELLSRLSETEVYAVVAHELAHVRRDDFAVNLLQTLLTNLFFFHPGVWWMSRRIDDEREHCCDDLAVEATGQAVPYAKTLISVSELEHALRSGTSAHPQLAMALSGKPSKRRNGGFGARIRRLFEGNAGAGTFREGFATAFILLGALGLSVVATSQADVPEQNVNAFSWSYVGADSTDAPVPPAPPLPPVSPGAVQPPGPGVVPAPSAPATAPAFPSSIDAPVPVAPSGPPPPLAPPAPVPGTESFRFGSMQPRIGSVRTPEQAALLQALWDEDLPTASALVATGMSLDFADGDGWTPLLVAATDDFIAGAELLVEAGASIDLVNARGWSALSESADEGAYRVARYLVESGAQLDHRYYTGGQAPLAQAAGEGEDYLVRYFLAKGANPNGENGSRPPLLAAAEEGENICALMLLDAGAEVDIADRYQRTALSYAAEEGNFQGVRLLLQRGAAVNSQDQFGRTAISYAADEGQQDVVELLLAAGASPGLADRFGKRPVDYAHENDETPAAALLTAADNRGGMEQQTEAVLLAESNTLQSSEQRTVHEQQAEQMRQHAKQNIQHAKAMQQQAEREVERVKQDVYRDVHRDVYRDIDRHVDLGGAGAGYSDPLFLAIQENKLDALRSLLDAGGNVEKRDKGGYTLLMIAVRRGRAAMVDLLLARGANVDARTPTDLQALHCAALEHRAALAVRLLEAGASVDATATYELRTQREIRRYTEATPLLVAICQGAMRTVEVLLDAGANPNHQHGRTVSATSNREASSLADWSPLYESVVAGNPQLIDRLRAEGGVARPDSDAFAYLERWASANGREWLLDRLAAD